MKTKLNNYNLNLEFLDSILKSLIKSNDHTLSKRNLYDASMQFSVKLRALKESIVFIQTTDNENIFNKAISFLSDEKLIDNTSENSLFITYKGILKLTQGGFVKEYKNSKRLNWFYVIYLIFTPLFACLSIALSIYALTCK